MVQSSQAFLPSLAIILLGLCVCSSSSFSLPGLGNGMEVKTETYLSPPFVLGPGSVENGFFYNIDFPRGHIFLKSLNAEIVDEFGNPIPLYETYLHHWAVWRYYQPANGSASHSRSRWPSDHILVGNSGTCQDDILKQYFGLGAETRQTDTYIPDPFGIEIGNPDEVPEGYVEQWRLNVHSIDTRGVVSRHGCIECHRDLYNVTVNEWGGAIPSDYKGGYLCCYTKTHCKLRQGFQAARRTVHLRYTVKWVDWDSSIIPVRIYLIDITDDGVRRGVIEDVPTYGCKVEYDVLPCSASDRADGKCIDVLRTPITQPKGGYVVYAVAHQHYGGIGFTAYRQDGSVICNSVPIYGEGNEVGNEAGYVVGMTSCHPEPGSIRVEDNERIILESNYSSTELHTGVMGHFYMLVADRVPSPSTSLHARLIHMHESWTSDTYYLWGVALFGLAIAVTLVKLYQSKNGSPNGYQPLLP